jgi:hypothetical protein
MVKQTKIGRFELVREALMEKDRAYVACVALETTTHTMFGGVVGAVESEHVEVARLDYLNGDGLWVCDLWFDTSSGAYLENGLDQCLDNLLELTLLLRDGAQTVADSSPE